MKRSDSTPTPLTFSTPERLVEDFVSRGFVVLAPENLGIPSDVHDRLYEQQKKAFDAKKPSPSTKPGRYNAAIRSRPAAGRQYRSPFPQHVPQMEPPPMEVWKFKQRFDF